MWFKKKKPEAPHVPPEQMSRQLRDQAFSVTFDQLGLDPDWRSRVWSVIMETGYEQGASSLVVFADGTTSLYFSGGGGIIGAGEHGAVQEASGILLYGANEHLNDFPATSQGPVPADGKVRFYVRTGEADLRGVEADEQQLGDGEHVLSPLFFAAHGVITAIREATPED